MKDELVTEGYLGTMVAPWFSREGSSGSMLHVDWRCLSPDALDTRRISGVQEPPNSGALLHEFLSPKKLLQLYGWTPVSPQESNQN